MPCRQISRFWISLCLVVFVLYLPLVQAQDYPGAAYFSYECLADSVTFYYQGSSVIHVSEGRTSQALTSAMTTQRNQLIAATSHIGLWALTSNELQIHLHNNTDGTKLVFPAYICGFDPQSRQNPTITSSQALAFAQSDGNGQAVAVAIVLPTGVVIAYAEVTGPGTALAIAQSTSTDNDNTVYVVQSGDTLYSIAQRNNTTVGVLVALNDIENPDQIFAGQRLVLP